MGINLQSQEEVFQKFQYLPEDRKLVLLTAQTIYALRLINIMNFPRHQRQHLQAQSKQRVRSLFIFLIFDSM